MDMIAQLETEFDALLRRVDALEAEKATLREQLDSEIEARKDIQARVEGLLQKVQEKLA